MVGDEVFLPCPFYGGWDRESWDMANLESILDYKIACPRGLGGAFLHDDLSTRDLEIRTRHLVLASVRWWLSSGMIRRVKCDSRM
jgi:hypothetical protein